MTVRRAKDIDPAIREWLYAREMLRRLGFSADDLFFAVVPTGNILTPGEPPTPGVPVIVLELRAQGKSFRWTIGPTTLDPKTIEGAYRDACALWNTGTAMTAFDKEFETSRPMQRKVELVMILREKGFVMS